MSEPVDKKLYEKIKKEIHAKYKPSAYRSGHLVKRYKKEFKEKYGERKAYKLKKKTKEKVNKVNGNLQLPIPPLKRWFMEDWKSDTGKYKYTSKSSVYRPTKRINKKTPKTFSELTKKEIDKAKRKKATKGRVDKF